MQKPTILIWGEFPPNTNTGVSVSNLTVSQNLLTSGYHVIKLEEYSWNKGSRAKLFHYFRLYARLYAILNKRPVRVFYFTLPISVLGMVKFLFPLVLIRIFFHRTQCLAHIHRSDFEVFISQSRLNDWLAKINLKLINEVIVLSPAFISPFSKFKNKIHVLPNTSGFEGEPRREKIYNRQFVCIANYIRSKGLSELIGCFKRDEFCEFELHIYGVEYDRKFVSELKSMASKNVKFHSVLPGNEIPETLQQFDALIIPSKNEGQPIIILEAMSLGIPVVAYRVGDIPDMLGEDYHYLAESLSDKTLAETLLHFHSTPNKNAIANYVYSRYREKYSNEMYREKLLYIFRSAMHD